MAPKVQIPAVPTVISPSPTPSEQSAREGYFPPSTRSSRNSGREEKSNIHNDDEHPDLSRARPRNRRKPNEATSSGGSTITTAKDSMPSTDAGRKSREQHVDDVAKSANGDVKGLLSPATAYQQAGYGSSYWRNLSRSPSPLGLIPIHKDFRAFIHKHEVPRKVLHVSIGFITLYLYRQGVQTSQIHPVLLSLLVPIFSIDVVRFRWPAFNNLYIKLLGPFMRESEAHDRYNGVISYLAGLWATMYFCKKDVAVMSVLLLSWCDTAASTFGRLLGKYTPKVRRGKSLAGSIACFLFGIGAAALFWGVIAPATNPLFDQGPNAFAFTGTLRLPAQLIQRLCLKSRNAQLSGRPALVVMSFASGLIASVSEAIDLWGLDDNLTIPVLCGLGIGLFLHVCGTG